MNNEITLSAGKDTISIDIDSALVKKNGEQLKLTKKEYGILKFLATHKGKSYSLEELYVNVWDDTYLPSSANTVMVHILRLRKKIEGNPSRPDFIKTIYGKGYQLD